MRVLPLVRLLTGCALVIAWLVVPFLRVGAQTTEDARFTDVTGQAGIAGAGDLWGLAWADYDHDDFLDLLVVNHFEKEPTLYHNNQDGTFTDRQGTSGITGAHDDRHDAGWMDYDNDGKLDLYITQGADAGQGNGPNQLYDNNGLAEFTDVAAVAGVEDISGRGRGAAWADYDRDGNLDLFVANARSSNGPNTFFHGNGDGTFTSSAAALGLASTAGATSPSWIDYDGDGDQDLFVTGPQNALYRNDGSTFTDVTGTAGVSGRNGASATWGDYDNDGDSDVYVSSGDGSGVPDYLVSASTVITFTGGILDADEDGVDFTVGQDARVTFHLQLVEMLPTFDPSLIHIGTSGTSPPTNPFSLQSPIEGPPPYTAGEDKGFFIWQSSAEQWHLRWSAPSRSQVTYFSGLITTTHPISDVASVAFDPYRFPRFTDQLLRNEGNGTFANVTAAAGLSLSVDSRGATWGDYDNDGDLDLFLILAGDVSGNAPDRLYRNNGDGTFSDVAVAAGVAGSKEGRGWAGAWADYDNDGFLDLYVHHRSLLWPIPPGSRQLFRNEGNSNHWLKVKLVSTTSNWDSMGAKVRVTTDGATQYQEVHDESAHFAHYRGPLHFGLGTHDTIREVRVTWPSGASQLLTDIAADQTVTLYESGVPESRADLSLTKSSDRSTVSEGDAVLYTLAYANSGPDSAHAVVVTDTLPASLSYVASSPPGLVHAATNEVSWALGTLAPGLTGQIALTATAHTVGTFTNLAEIATSSTETFPADNSTELPVEVVPPPTPPTTGEFVAEPTTSSLLQPTTFLTSYRDINGWEDITRAEVRVNVGTRLRGGFLAQYRLVQGSPQLLLFDDAGTLVGTCDPGSATTLTNSRVELHCAESVVDGTGDTLTVRWRVTPVAPFSDRYGTYSAYLRVYDRGGATDGWDLAGTWTLVE